MFKIYREHRYRELIAAGFMGFEAFWLSQIPFSRHPGMAHIIRKRRKLQEKRLREATRKGLSEAKCQRIWNIRTKKMYQRRHWICRYDHPTGQGPRTGEPNPFALYRFYERSEVNPMPGDSRSWDDEKDGTKKRWVLERAEILLFRAKKAKRIGDYEKCRVALSELDKIIEHASPKRQAALKALKKKI
jgi:hypothetical protein